MLSPTRSTTTMKLALLWYFQHGAEHFVQSRAFISVGSRSEKSIIWSMFNSVVSSTYLQRFSSSRTNWRRFSFSAILDSTASSLPLMKNHMKNKTENNNTSNSSILKLVTSFLTEWLCLLPEMLVQPDHFSLLGIF